MARTNKYTSLNFNHIFDKNPNSSTTSSTASAASRSPSATALPHKSYSLSASSRLVNGGMLVLSRPSPKPQPQPQQPQPQSQPPPQTQLGAPSSVDFPAITSPQSSKPLDSDSMISLRPQGKTGGSLSFQERENNSKVDVPSPKSNKFVPPHLRPGFVARDVPSVPEFQKLRPGNHHRPTSAHGNYHGSPNQYGDDARPKSGGGYHRPGSAHGYYHGYADSGRPNSGGGSDRRMRGAPSSGVESESFLMNRSRSGGSRPNSRG